MKHIHTFESYITEAGRMIRLTKKDWDKADGDQKEEWLLQVIKDPDDAEQYIEFKWEDLPSDMTQNMYK
jgi:hypothetical protein